MNNLKKTLVAWLKDAHAMEQNSIKMLNKQADRLQSYPDMEHRIRAHAEESENQASRVKECLRSLGEDTSSLKDTMGSMTAGLGAVGTASSSDEVVKNALGDYAFEHFEIACYRSLVTAAEHVGETGVANACRDILREEERMADWVDNNLSTVTREYLAREASDAQSKR